MDIWNISTMFENDQNSLIKASEASYVGMSPYLKCIAQIVK